MTATDALRQTTAKYLIPYLFVHVPVVWLTGMITGNDALIPTALAAAFAAAPAISWRLTGTGPLTRYLTAASFMLIVAVLVYAFRSHPWQIDIHMYFFAGLAMLLGFADWRVYAVATGVVAVHHLALNFTVPFWVFPQGADFFRVVLHAVIVVVETAVLAIGTLKLVDALDEATVAVRDAEEASRKAEIAQRDAEAALGQAEVAQRDAEAAGQQAQEASRRQVEAEAERVRELELIAADFEVQVGGIVKSVNSASASLKALALAMTDASEDVQGSAQNASQTTSSISGNVDAVAEASKELAASVREISAQIGKSNETTTHAVDLSSRASENVRSLTDKVGEIQNFVEVISGITEQINLLALNATIEAARAGEAGKGFAVVASEVGNLASQSAKAAEQIEQQINAVVSSTEQTSADIEAIGTSIESLREAAAIIAAAIEEQGASTQSIADNATQTAGDVSTFSALVGNVTDGVAKSASQAQDVLGASEALQGESENLAREVQAFVTKLRPADDLKEAS
ncbi:MAG: hypothetical protein JJ900_08605 [Rhodospirillales bacterium]|nr:hypothetical protein [Rhodospirillales bacterium]MBO6786898.1 hypothetical protein [Rhodospirillales bacterium]